MSTVIDSIDLVKDSTMQTTNLLLAAIASNNGGIGVKSWGDVQQLVRLGLASKIFAIGDQLVCEKAIDMNATVGNTEGNSGITSASVVPAKFLEAMGEAHNGDYKFTYNGIEWYYNGECVTLSEYGITYSGDPVTGDEIVIHETADQLVWDIIGIDHDKPIDSRFNHSLTLQLHDCYTSMQFDAREALYCTDEGLAAGTYNFTVKNQAWYSSDNNKTFQFTLTKAVPPGGQLVLTNAPNATINGTKMNVFEKPTDMEASEQADISEGNDGTALGNTESTSNMNHMHSAIMGYSRYEFSAMRQYLNSDAAVGKVWTPLHKFDRPPVWVSNTAGFLNNVDASFVNVLGKVEKETTFNTYDGGSFLRSEESVFLLSRSEVYGDELKDAEGEPYPYYEDTSRLASSIKPNTFNRIKYRNGSAQNWWLRSSNISLTSHVRTVTPFGEIYNDRANNSYGVAPACCII